MPKAIKKPKYSVVCKGCGNTVKFKAEDILYKYDRISGAPDGVPAPYVDRYFVECKCGSHPNVARIASEEMKTAAKERVKKPFDPAQGK
jgi:hypothetical protein